jgi:hypothetical protein
VAGSATCFVIERHANLIKSAQRMNATLIRTVTLLTAAIASGVPSGAADLNAPYAQESPALFLYDWTAFCPHSNFGGGLDAENASLPLDSFRTNPSGELGGSHMGDNDPFAPDWLLLGESRPAGPHC